MTLLIVLAFGLGAILIVSAIESDPKTGTSISVLQTMVDVWNNDLPSGSTSASSASSTAGQASSRAGQVPQFGSSAHYDTYRNAVVQAYLQSQR